MNKMTHNPSDGNSNEKPCIEDQLNKVSESVSGDLLTDIRNLIVTSPTGVEIKLTSLTVLELKKVIEIVNENENSYDRLQLEKCIKDLNKINEYLTARNNLAHSLNKCVYQNTNKKNKNQNKENFKDEALKPNPNLNLNTNCYPNRVLYAKMASSGGERLERVNVKADYSKESKKAKETESEKIRKQEVFLEKKRKNIEKLKMANQKKAVDRNGNSNFSDNSGGFFYHNTTGEKFIWCVNDNGKLCMDFGYYYEHNKILYNNIKNEGIHCTDYNWIMDHLYEHNKTGLYNRTKNNGKEELLSLFHL